MGGQWKYILLASKIIMPEANFKHCMCKELNALFIG